VVEEVREGMGQRGRVDVDEKKVTRSMRITKGNRVT
jgi:hypothetical protein